MKKILLSLIVFLSLTGKTYGQKFHQISLKNETLNLGERKFFIKAVIDSRAKKYTIGIVQKGPFNIKRPAQLENGLPNALLYYFQNALPKEKSQIPITIKVMDFRISEKTRLTQEYGFAEITLDFYYNGLKLHSSSQKIEIRGMDVTKYHEENIRKALRASVLEFNKSNWLEKLNNEKGDAKMKDQTTNDIANYVLDNNEEEEVISVPKADKSDEPLDRDVTVVGYQIGGYTLLGIDHEARIHDYLGIHFGAGFLGFTGGLKIHTNPSKNSPYFNISFKDGGFGLISTVGVEIGGRVVLNNRNDFGLHFQIGVAKILTIDDNFAEELFVGRSTPSAILAVGVGFSW